jgi:flagellar motor switch protein FliG
MPARNALSGRQKAAMLLVSLGPEAAANVLRHLHDEEIEALTFEIASLHHVTPEERDEVIQECYQLALAREYVSLGGLQYARDLLERSLGPQRAAEILERLTSSLQITPFDAFRRMDPAQLSSLLQQEHPQTIALVVAYLKPAQAAAVLASLPRELQVEVAQRVAVMDRTTPETIREVEMALESKLVSLPTQEFTAVGGVQALVSIINQSDRATERAILEALEERDPELAAQVKKLMFVFEDLLNLDDRSIQIVLRNVDSKDLVLALKGSSEELREKIFRNMSQRAAEALREDLQLMGPVRRRDVEEAQGRIVTVVRQLEESGQIVLVRGGQEEVLV